MQRSNSCHSDGPWQVSYIMAAAYLSSLINEEAAVEHGMIGLLISSRLHVFPYLEGDVETGISQDLAGKLCTAVRFTPAD